MYGAEKWNQTAEELSKALKNNSNYKVVFVATLETGKIKPEDFLAIKTVCNLINKPFEYGLIFNKATEETVADISNKGIESYLVPLEKKPYATVVLKMENEDSQKEKNGFSVNSENSVKLLEFFSKLAWFNILQNEVKTVDMTGFQETQTLILKKQLMQEEDEKQWRMDVDKYFLKHASKKNINWDNILLPEEFPNYDIKKQATMVAYFYKNLLYDKDLKYGGWRLLARNCYKRNKFARLLSPEEMGFICIEPREFKDEVYEKQLIRYLRDGELSLGTIKGYQVNPYYMVVPVKNETNKDIEFTVPKGQIFEVEKFVRTQNLAIIGEIRFPKTGDTSTYEVGNLATSYKVKAGESIELKFSAACTDRRYAPPNNTTYEGPTNYVCKKTKDEIDPNDRNTQVLDKPKEINWEDSI